MPDEVVEVHAHPARVQAQPVSPELLERARALAPDPSIFDESPPFFWSAEISSDRLDSYFTRMAVSSLRNYAEDATRGVSFQNSHKTRELPFGRSLTGLFFPAEGEGPARTEADFYTLRGLNLNGVSTDEFINGVRSGIVSDVSIGFSGGEYICSVCQRDMWRDWDCVHIPGVEYIEKPKEGEGGDSRIVLAIAWIENARLSEVSSVYDGATPGATILKAYREAEAGRLKPETARLLEGRYQMRFSPRGRSFPGADLPKQEDTMPNEADPLAPVRAVLTEARIDAADPAKAVRSLVGDVQRLRPLETALQGRCQEGESPEAALNRICAQAEDGATYRADLVTEAIAEGVRAYGTDFAEADERADLERSSIAAIKRRLAQWKVVGDQTLTGGRRTVEGDERERPNDRPALPPGAYS